MVEAVLFVIFGLAAIFGAVTMVWARNPVYSAMGLMLTMFSIAELSFVSSIEEGSMLTVPLRVLGVMFAAPFILAGAAISHVSYGWRYLGLTIAGLITAVLWCFMSGIVLIVLTDMLMSL